MFRPILRFIQGKLLTEERSVRLCSSGQEPSSALANPLAEVVFYVEEKWNPDQVEDVR
jgi:hypothetical protein